MPAHLAEPQGPGPHPAVIVFMEAFGLTRHIEDVTDRIAGEGYVALAPDVYYRDLPNNKFGYDELGRAIQMMTKLDFERFVGDAAAALDFLAERDDVDARRIGVTGFCMGGNLAFRTACELPERVAAAVSFYGGGIDAIVDEAERLRAPLYLFFGGKDQFISAEQVRKIEQGLRRLGKQARSRTWPDADHGFFCDERESYHATAAEEAWRELLAFFATHLRS